jgi:hypothetical protein
MLCPEPAAAERPIVAKAASTYSKCGIGSGHSGADEDTSVQRDMSWWRVAFSCVKWFVGCCVFGDSEPDVPRSDEPSLYGPHQGGIFWPIDDNWKAQSKLPPAY